jgi:hypothetical protein
VLEERLLDKLKQTTPPAHGPGSTQAVLQFFGPFRDEDDSRGKLSSARKRREDEE